MKAYTRIRKRPSHSKLLRAEVTFVLVIRAHDLDVADRDAGSSK